MPIVPDNYNTIILKDQLIIITSPMTSKKYPKTLRRIVYYAPELNKTFIYITNNVKLEAEQIALLYKYRWQIELFFKWIKQHLRIKSFWGTTENAVKIQIYTAITAYCLVAIIEHDLKLDRSIYDVLRILGASLLGKTPIRELFSKHTDNIFDEFDQQLCLNFF
jgi:transposase